MDDSQISSQPTVYTFLRTILGDWFTRMSGPLTVPFAAAAVYVKGATPKVLFSILAVICGVFSAYWIWRKERLARIEVERAFSEARTLTDSDQDVFVRDILAELQDDLKSAMSRSTRSPFGQGAYMRPSDAAWKQCRSKVQLPDQLRREIQEIYDLIGRWISIVDSGVKPALGSADLEMTAQMVAARLPAVIAELEKL